VLGGPLSPSAAAHFSESGEGAKGMHDIDLSCQRQLPPWPVW